MRVDFNFHFNSDLGLKGDKPILKKSSRARLITTLAGIRKLNRINKKTRSNRSFLYLASLESIYQTVYFWKKSLHRSDTRKIRLLLHL